MLIQKREKWVKETLIEVRKIILEKDEKDEKR